jgi:HD-GYP domain-containing protein (c-di-GMP phosphodiesterase class II)
LPRETAQSVASAISALARESEGRPYADLAAILATDLGLKPEELSELRSSGLLVV